MINPIVLKIIAKDRKKLYEMYYKDTVIFSSSDVEKTTEYAKKKIAEGYYIKYSPSISESLL